MVISNDFDTLDTHDTSTQQIETDQQNVGGNTCYVLSYFSLIQILYFCVYICLLDEDGMADPKCIEKYTQRKEDEEDLGSQGPNGQRLCFCIFYLILLCNECMFFL